jgi:hypothetical protein
MKKITYYIGENSPNLVTLPAVTIDTNSQFFLQ